MFEIKATQHANHDPGVVAVLDAFPSEDPRSFVGRVVRLREPSGRASAVRVDDVRAHGATISLFFGGLTPADLSDGTRVEFDD